MTDALVIMIPLPFVGFLTNTSLGSLTHASGLDVALDTREESSSSGDLFSWTLVRTHHE